MPSDDNMRKQAENRLQQAAVARELTPAELAQRRAAPVKHGASSEVAVRAVSTAQKRAFLRANGLRLSDLDGMAVELLDGYARVKAKVVMMDAWFDQSGGFLDEEGKPKPAARLYFLATNAAGRALGALEEHLAAHRPGEESLDSYLARKYGSGAVVEDAEVLEHEPATREEG